MHALAPLAPDLHTPDASDRAVRAMMLDRLDHGTDERDLVSKAVAWFEGALSTERATRIAADALAEAFEGAVVSW